MAAPLPPDEPARLQALLDLGILDTPPEAFTASVVAAAATLANTPMSAVSLIDADRQWFKGSVGLVHTQTARAVSFCAHALLQAAPLLIHDTLKDERFRSNPLVTSAPHIRFYAGFPLIVRGRAIGALCVIDDRPRHMDAQQLEQLARLATGTSAWLAQYTPEGT